MLIECCYHKNLIEVENTFECGYCDECDLCPDSLFNSDDGEEASIMITYEMIVNAQEIIVDCWEEDGKKKLLRNVQK